MAARLEERVVCEGPINRDVLCRGSQTPTTRAGKAITATGHGSGEQRGAIQIALLCLATYISGTDLFWILILIAFGSQIWLYSPEAPLEPLVGSLMA